MRNRRNAYIDRNDAATELSSFSVWSSFVAILLYIVDIAKLVLTYLKKPIAISVVIAIIVGVIWRFLAHTGLIWSTRDGAGHGLPRANYPELLDLETRTLELVLGDTMSGTALAIDLKKAQVATGDLIIFVKISDLDCKEALADALSMFVVEAKSAASHIHSLNAKADSAVDR